MRTCKKCQGSMFLERAIDVELGVSMMFFACLNCGQRTAAERKPRPLAGKS